MRLCLNDAGLGAPYRDITLDRLRIIRDIGFRVAGMHPDIDATDRDINHVKSLFGVAGLAFGPLGIGASAIHPDAAQEREYHRVIARHLEIGGKLGCTTLRYSVGSLNPDDIWGPYAENHTQKALDRLIEKTKPLVAIAEKHRVALCPETTQWTIVGTIERMAEFVDRLDSPYAKIIFDPVNHMRYDRVYDSGRWMRCAVAMLGDRIGVLHIKDVQVDPSKLLVSHIDEAPMGLGLLDHAPIIEVSSQLEGWKTFSLEHFSDPELDTAGQWKRAYNHIQGVANRIGHHWTDPGCTRALWDAGQYR